MKRREDRNTTPTDHKIRRSALITVICDVILIVALVACLLIYSSSNNDSTYNQNIENLVNISSASSQLAEAALESMSYEIESAYNYCNGKSVSEILDYLSLINSADSEYQLLKRDEEVSTNLFHVYSGWSTKKRDGDYPEITYKDTSLSLSIFNYSNRENGVVSYSQSFTNKTDALRYFAVFCGLTVVDESGEQRYFLIKPQKESKVLDQAQTFTQYQDLAVAICYNDGKYLARDDNFRAENFFDYLYDYNGLSMDEKNDIKASVMSNMDGSGVLIFNDLKGRESAFAYSVCGSSENWLVIISVPVSEFVGENLLSFFPLTIIIFLAVLLLFNIYRLLVIVNKLRLSVKREQVANAAKGNFMSRMSHEIRTPLNAVIGYNTIARNEINEAQSDADRKQAEMKVMDCLSKSEIASKHLLTIINDVLDMSAIESGKIQVSSERFDFKGLITSLTTVFYSQARSKNVEFEVVFDTLTEEWFIGDQMRTNQILTNLLSNAVKFTPSGGKVSLRIYQPEAETNASHIHFEVTDTGIGMTAEYLTHIWMPFEQADSSISRRFGGTGLGLSITKNLVDLMGGQITVKSTPGEGSSFGVDLTFEKTEQPISTDTYDFSAINALVVDDDPSTCDYIRLLFNRCGARCAAVTSGADAVKAVSVAKEQGNSFSVCLVDWRMPEMDGIETVRKIKEIVREDMPLIVLTAYNYTELADMAMDVGVSKFLSKPLFQSTLFDLLANICGTQSSKQVENSESIDFGGQRVLLAEDNAMNMEIARAIMESAGLAVDGAWNGREAVEMFEASPQGTYMAILMDVHMPEMNGHDATRTIRASSHPEALSIPIIAMTADAFAENVAEAHASGMNDHIAKPIDIPTLFATLEKYKRKG